MLASLYRTGEPQNGPIERWFSTHPPMDERIERLVETAEARSHRAGSNP